MTDISPLQVRAVTKRYGAVTALRDVSVDFFHGQVVGLIGDNGAGKSTLVKILAGTQRPDDGHLIVNGEPTTFHAASDAHAAGIETVFQTLSLVPTLSVVENVYLARERIVGRPWSWLRRLDKAGMLREASDKFEQLGLRLPSLTARVSGLSGGQRQAVAIARGALWGRRILILDEPTAALGVRQSEAVLSLIDTLKTQGFTVILVTHNMEHVARACDRVVVLRLGRKVADASMEEVDKMTLVGMMTGAYE